MNISNLVFRMTGACVAALGVASSAIACSSSGPDEVPVKPKQPSREQVVTVDVGDRDLWAEWSSGVKLDPAKMFVDGLAITDLYGLTPSAPSQYEAIAQLGSRCVIVFDSYQLDDGPSFEGVITPRTGKGTEYKEPQADIALLNDMIHRHEAECK